MRRMDETSWMIDVHRRHSDFSRRVIADLAVDLNEEQERGLAMVLTNLDDLMRMIVRGVAPEAARIKYRGGKGSMKTPIQQHPNGRFRHREFVHQNRMLEAISLLEGWELVDKKKGYEGLESGELSSIAPTEQTWAMHSMDPPSDPNADNGDNYMLNRVILRDDNETIPDDKFMSRKVFKGLADQLRRFNSANLEHQYRCTLFRDHPGFDLSRMPGAQRSRREDNLTDEDLTRRIDPSELGAEMPDGSILYEPRAVVYHRTFNRGALDASCGGRAFNAFTNLLSQFRMHTEIDGEPIVHADFKCLHLRMCYHHFAKTECTDIDLYDLGEHGREFFDRFQGVVACLQEVGIHTELPAEEMALKIGRSIIKGVMTAAINASEGIDSILQSMNQPKRNPKTGRIKGKTMLERTLRKLDNWDAYRQEVRRLGGKGGEEVLTVAELFRHIFVEVPPDLKKNIRGDLYQEHIEKRISESQLCPSRLQVHSDVFQQVKDAILARHPAIREQFAADRGIELMNMDSKMAALIGDRFRDAGQGILLLHDGFYAAQSQRDLLVTAMQEAYQEVIGWELPEDRIDTETLEDIQKKI